MTPLTTIITDFVLSEVLQETLEEEVGWRVVPKIRAMRGGVYNPLVFHKYNSKLPQNHVSTTPFDCGSTASFAILNGALVNSIDHLYKMLSVLGSNNSQTAHLNAYG